MEPNNCKILLEIDFIILFGRGERGQEKMGIWVKGVCRKSVEGRREVSKWVEGGNWVER
jgi:hypothetical protein